MSITKSSTEESLNKDSVKKPLKRFEIAFRKFADIAIPMHLELLRKQRGNIEKYQRLEEWDRVHVEQVNASRTVQQLTADMWEIERVRSQIREDDLPVVDKRLEPLKTAAQEAIQEFLSEHKEVHEPICLLKQSRNEEDLSIEAPNVQEANGIQIQQSRNKTVSSSWRILYNDLLELNKLIHVYSHAVHTQQPLVNDIENNLEETSANVETGAHYLGKSVATKAVLYPVIGAVIGCLAGPFGAIAGAKIGVAVAIGGGAIGYAGGKILQKRKQTIAAAVDVELKEISNERKKDDFRSLPDISTQDVYLNQK